MYSNCYPCVMYIHCCKSEDLIIRLFVVLFETLLYILQWRVLLIWQSECVTVCLMYCYIRQDTCFDKYKYHSLCHSDLFFF